jgi:hypothetical protein
MIVLWGEFLLRYKIPCVSVVFEAKDLFFVVKFAALYWERQPIQARFLEKVD